MGLFVSSLDQLLQVIEIESEDSNGFLRSNGVTLQATLNADKLIMVEVYIDGRLAQPPHYLNPFANRPVSPKERSVCEEFAPLMTVRLTAMGVPIRSL